MRKVKILCYIIVGAVCGAALMYLAFPFISDYFVGPIYGKDQISVNAAIFFTGLPLLALIGALAGWITGLKTIRSR